MEFKLINKRHHFLHILYCMKIISIILLFFEVGSYITNNTASIGVVLGRTTHIVSLII